MGGPGSVGPADCRRTQGGMVMGFEIKQARREQVPVMVGLMGPSGSGKTYSALRLATGLAGGGKIAVIAVADAHPLGARPFARKQYEEKFTTLADGVVDPAEQQRFPRHGQASTFLSGRAVAESLPTSSRSRTAIRTCTPLRTCSSTVA